MTRYLILIPGNQASWTAATPEGIEAPAVAQEE